MLGFDAIATLPLSALPVATADDEVTRGGNGDGRSRRRRLVSSPAPAPTTAAELLEITLILLLEADEVEVA